jgi:hypothetical protein
VTRSDGRTLSSTGDPMPLPKENSAWLPRDWAPAFDRYRLNEALWLNNTETLRSILQGGSYNTVEGRTMAEQRKRGGVFLDLLRRWNWGQAPAEGEKRTNLPVPIGANIIDLSAAQLMSEAPRFRVVERDAKTGRRAMCRIASTGSATATTPT